VFVLKGFINSRQIKTLNAGFQNLFPRYAKEISAYKKLF